VEAYVFRARLSLLSALSGAFLFYVLYISSMTASIPDGMSFSELVSLLESAPSDVTDAPQSDDDEDTLSALQKIADKHLQLALEEVNDPMVHKLMIMRALSNMVDWHNRMGFSHFEDNDTDIGGAWLRDAGKFQACMDIMMSIKIGPDDDCVHA